MADANPRSLQRLDWSNLNTLQIGRYAEYLVKMEFTLYGFQVYSSEVDDRGIDFVARFEQGPFIEVQVKSVRSLNYIFFEKTKFALSDSLWAAIVLFSDASLPQMFLIPSTRWAQPDEMFKDRNYEGLKSKPEYGLNLSRKNLHILKAFEFEQSVQRLVDDEAGLVPPMPKLIEGQH